MSKTPPTAGSAYREVLKGRQEARQTGFELGAEVLEINIKALVAIYNRTIEVVNTMMKGGKANAALSFFGTLIYADMLHGGAYACPINQRPYYVPGSIYDAGDLKNLAKEGLIDWVTQVFGGTGAKPTALFDEVLVNANCPHIFPKLLSDEAYALTKLGLAYQGGVNLFEKSAQSLATLVEAESSVISAGGEAAAGIGRGASALSPLLSLLAGGA